MSIRENFLSLNDIIKQNKGFQFFDKNERLFELISVTEKWICVAEGFLGDKYQKRIIIKFIDEIDNQYTISNLTNETNNGDIFNFAYIEKDWDKLEYLTYSYVRHKQKKEYLTYIENALKNGNITEKEYQRVLYDMAL
jgi:hypothetical protein